MVSESDLPRPVSGPMLNAPAGPEATGSADPEERLGQYLKHAEQLHDNFSRPGVAGRADPEERLEWRQKVNIFKATYSFIAMTYAAD